MELETLTEKKTTEVGSYFVANYPPFSVWSNKYAPDLMAALDSPPKPDTKLGLYLHIPFCRKRCKFCYFRVYTDKNADEVETYLDALSREIALYAGREGFGGRQFEFVQGSWINDPSFNKLHDDVDPLLGNRGRFTAAKGPQSAEGTFTIPASPVRLRVRGLKNFITMRGGAYFFLPGKAALQYLVQC